MNLPNETMAWRHVALRTEFRLSGPDCNKTVPKPYYFSQEKGSDLSESRNPELM